MTKKPTIVDIAEALGVSTATVHRALHNGPDVTAATRNRVLLMAKKLGYKPNLAARSLASKRRLRISVNTPRGITSFWNEVWTGIEEEKRSLDIDNVVLEFRTYSQMGTDELAAFEATLDSGVDGIIAFPGNPEGLKPLMKQAARAKIPVVFVATDAPGTERLAIVSVDTLASGSLAADLMGKIIRGRGAVGVTLTSTAIIEHMQKYDAFRETMHRLHSELRVQAPIEDHGTEQIAYEKSRKFLVDHKDVAGMYVTTEASIPVINAARDLGRLDKVTIVATDLFPALVEEMRGGAVVATIYQRPRTQGRMAFRVLYDYLVNGENPPLPTSFAPHLVMPGNLDFFLQRVSMEFSPGESRRLDLGD